MVYSETINEEQMGKIAAFMDLTDNGEKDIK